MMHPSKTWGGKSAKSLWNEKGAKRHKTQSGIQPEALKKGTIEESSGEVKKELENLRRRNLDHRGKLQKGLWKGETIKNRCIHCWKWYQKGDNTGLYNMFSSGIAYTTLKHIEF